MFGFDSIDAVMPILEKKLKLKKTDLRTVEEFKSGLQSLNAGATDKAERYLAEFEVNGRPAVAILVLK